MAVRSAYLAKKGDKPAKDKPDLKNSALSAELELKAFHDMLLIRRFEEKAGQLYGMGSIGGFCHLYIGQEAVVVGLEMAASEGDQRITSYRDHGHMLACGMDPKGVMAELTGKKGGYSHSPKTIPLKIGETRSNTIANHHSRKRTPSISCADN